MNADVRVLNLEFLTPVYIGSGNELDPLSYVVRKGSDGKDYLYLVDIESWLADNSSNEDILNAFNEMTFQDLRIYVAKNIPLSNYVLESIPISSAEFTKTYNKMLRNKKDENQLLVELMPRNNVQHRPYIPGSSIKGAIRTAIANQHINIKKDDKSNWRDLNKAIFGPPIEDILKYLKLSDAALPPSSTQIVQPLEISKNPERKSKTSKNFKNFAETTQSLALTNGLNTFIKISLNSSPPTPSLPKKNRVRPFVLEDLFQWLNDFYIQKYRQEIKKFYQQFHLEYISKNLEQINQKVDSIEKNSQRSALLRIGHYSHVECVTLNDLRQPKTRNNKYGTTRTLAEGKVPFGWVKVSIDEQHYSPKIFYVESSSSRLDKGKEASKEIDGMQAKEEETYKAEVLLEDLRKRLYAISIPKLAGTLPNIAKEILEAEDQKYAALAANEVLNFIKSKKLHKKFKIKDWYKKLVEIGSKE